MSHGKLNINFKFATFFVQRHAQIMSKMQRSTVTAYINSLIEADMERQVRELVKPTKPKRK